MGELIIMILVACACGLAYWLVTGRYLPFLD
jgi:hypothetical protein